MALKYVVVTSVDRDDLRDGGAAHFVECIRAMRAAWPGIVIEILTPDFRGRMDVALEILGQGAAGRVQPHLETVLRLYRQARPGADYQYSLTLLQRFKERHPHVPTKSGLMLGLGETTDGDRSGHARSAHPSRGDADPRPVSPAQRPSSAGGALRAAGGIPSTCALGEAMGFTHVASAPLVRSSYHADAGQGCRVG